MGNERPIIELIREFRKFNAEWERYNKDLRLSKPLGILEFAELCERKFAVALVPKATEMTHDELIEVLAAHRDGRRIQSKLLCDGSDWEDYPSLEEGGAPPCCDWHHRRYRIKPVPDEQRPFHHFDTRKLERALDITNCHIDDSIEFVAGQMLDPAVRKRVLEARVFEPE